MLTEVVIVNGLQDWQIVQQKDGWAQIELSGTWRVADHEAEISGIHARVIMEDTGAVLIPWTACKIEDNGKWQVMLKDVPAGGLYRVETCLDHSKKGGIRGDILHHIGVGDIFVIAGQSNAAGYGKEPIFDPPKIGVSAFKNSGKWDLASHPLSDTTGSDSVINRELGIPGHSPYLHFAKILKRGLGYPIGLIQTAIGGSSLSMWNPNEDGVLYRNMLKRVKQAGGTVKAVLWYQGCADTGEDFCDSYQSRFENLVKCLRFDLGDMELPIFTVQINRYVVPAGAAEDIGWGKLREAQRRIAKEVPNVYIVPASDCTLSDAIHNASSSNLKLGERLANLALAKLYGEKCVFEAPDISKAERLKPNQIQLWFENVKGNIYTFEVGPEKLPFTVIDDDGELKIVQYEINRNNGILLFLDRVICVLLGTLFGTKS